jgi:hypothetical protein
MITDTKPEAVRENNGRIIKDPVSMERKVLHRASNLVDSLASAMVLAREAEDTISVDDLIKLLDPIIDTLKDLTKEHFPE